MKSKQANDTMKSMPTATIKDAVDSMEAYIEKYENNLIESNAPDAWNEFQREWVTISEYFYTVEKMPDELCARALCIYSASLERQRHISKKQVEQVQEAVDQFTQIIKYKYGTKHSIYHNIGLGWAKLGLDDYRGKALQAFKKSIHYLLLNGFNTTYRVNNAYKYVRCSEYLFRDLINEELTFSPAQYFNDPFDCPVLELLNHDEQTAQLIRQAYHECLTVTCFSRNERLPTSNPTQTRYKTDPLREDYLNELMWAHYADSHRGICIKYSFTTYQISQLGDQDKGYSAFFRDIKYSSESLEEYSTGGKTSITLADSFFLKGDMWSYEKELRLVRFDLDGHGTHKSIPIPGCIEAVYFGIQCSEQDKKTIRKILEGKAFIEYKEEPGQEDFSLVPESKGVRRTPIKFYEMEKDPEHFGRVRVKQVSKDLQPLQKALHRVYYCSSLPLHCNTKVRQRFYGRMRRRRKRQLFVATSPKCSIGKKYHRNKITSGRILQRI